MDTRDHLRWLHAVQCHLSEMKGDLEVCRETTLLAATKALAVAVDLRVEELEDVRDREVHQITLERLHVRR